MDESKRTTVTADRDDLDTLAAEAERRGVAFTDLAREAIADKAAEIRRRRRPSVGVARSDDGRSAAEVASEPVSRPPS